MIDNSTNRIKLLNYLIIGIFILIFVGLIITSRSLAQWPPYSEPFFNPAFSFLNSPYTNSFTSSLFPSFGSRGSESYGNYINVGINNSYNFPPSIFSSFPGTLGGLYGGPNGGLYASLTNYNTFSHGLFSPLTPNTHITPLFPGSWATTPSPWQGLTVTANNSWTGMPSVVPPYNLFNPFPFSNPYVPNISSSKTINIEDEEYLVYSALIEEKFSSDSAILKQTGFKGENPYFLLDLESMESLEKETIDDYTMKNAKQYTLEDEFTLEGDYELTDDNKDRDSWDVAFSRVGFNSEKNQAVVHVAKNFSTTFYFLIKEDGIWKVESGYMDTVM